ncbi:MAG: DMT family transporter [Ignavibacteria bacterium]|nr:DMT family transporter [Ignavibacteria bacterium]
MLYKFYLLIRELSRTEINIKAYIALAVGIIFIGFSAIFVKMAGVPGMVSAFYRSLIAGVVLFPWWMLKKKTVPGKSELKWIVTGGVFFAIDLALWNTSLLLTTAATATLLANNAPIWVGLGAMILFKEKLTYKYWLGLIIALFGMSVLVGFDAIRNLNFNGGDLLALTASLFYAVYLLTTQRARTKTDTLTFMSVSTLSTVIVLLVINLFAGSELTGFTLKTWTALLGLGLISHLGGWLLINYALGHMKASGVSVTLLSQAVVTALLAIPFLGEMPDINQIIGGVFVLTGIYLVNVRSSIEEGN